MVILAELQTRHFLFSVIELDRAHAMRALQLAWTIHQRQTGATASFAEVAEDITYQQMAVGTVYRDGAAMPDRA